jgi:hypothetical protein
VLNQVRVALPFLVTTADDSKDVPTEEVCLRFLLIFMLCLLFPSSHQMK